MPELPEVETFKRYLNATSLHQRIIRVDVRDAYVLKGVTARELARRLKGVRFEFSYRHGKNLFVCADGDFWLRLHFGMTGSLEYFKNEQKAPERPSAEASADRHRRVLFIFERDRCLAFNDQRKFGEIGFVDDMNQFLENRGLGPDALEISLPQFRQMLRKHRGALKSILLNQKLIAGIGNIYADEILFHARINPTTQGSALATKKIAELFRATRNVLKRAIRAKADIGSMPKSWLLPRREKSGKCPRCGRHLKSATIAGRTTWFCAHCQKRI